MAAHGDESGGMTVLTKGLYEYEHLSEEPGALALTLMRGNGFIFKFSDDPEAPNPLWRVPENQCLRPVEVEFALMPATGTIGPTESLWALEQYRTPLLPHFHAVDLRRFSGGRPGVQDTEVKEIFYQEPYHPERVLPQSGGLLQVEGKVLVSAVKRARRGTDMLLRLYSVEEKKVTARIDTAAALLAAFETDLEEEPTRPLPLSRGGLNVEIAPRQILTLRLQLDPGNPWG